MHWHSPCSYTLQMQCMCCYLIAHMLHKLEARQGSPSAALGLLGQALSPTAPSVLGQGTVQSRLQGWLAHVSWIRAGKAGSDIWHTPQTVTFAIPSIQRFFVSTFFFVRAPAAARHGFDVPACTSRHLCTAQPVYAALALFPVMNICICICMSCDLWTMLWLECQS